MKAKKSKLPQRKDNGKLPGYPHYSEFDDIMSKKKNAEQVDIDVENLSPSHKNKVSGLKKTKPMMEEENNSPIIVPGSEADLTPEDLKLLGDKDRDMDEGEDETLLTHLELNPDFSGDDLDVPGAELDDDNEDIGSEDEENNYYSHGQN